MDQVDAVRAFLEVAERQSFTAAAKRLGLSKALVSKHVAALEARAGARLLNRSTRHVSLTEAGEAFLGRARDAVSAWDVMMEAATQDAARPSGLLRVAGPKVFGETVLAGLLASFLREQPNLRLELALEERRVDVIAEGYDLSVRVGEPQDSQLIGVVLTAFPYVFCAAPDYLAERGRPETPEDLREHDCIVNTAITEDGKWRFAKGGSTLRLAPPARVVASNDTPVAVFVRAGLGIGLCMRRRIEPELADGRLVPLLEDWNAYDRKVHALIPHRAMMPAKTRLLLDHLRRHLRA